MDYLFYGHLKPVFLISQITLTHNICFDNTVDGATTEIENLNSFFLLSSSPTRFPTRIHTHNESDECKRVQFSSLLSRLCSYVKIIKNKDFALAEIRTLHLRVSRRILNPGTTVPRTLQHLYIVYNYLPANLSKISKGAFCNPYGLHPS